MGRVLILRGKRFFFTDFGRGRIVADDIIGGRLNSKIRKRNTRLRLQQARLRRRITWCWRCTITYNLGWESWRGHHRLSSGAGRRLRGVWVRCSSYQRWRSKKRRRRLRCRWFVYDWGVRGFYGSWAYLDWWNSPGMNFQVFSSILFRPCPYQWISRWTRCHPS